MLEPAEKRTLLIAGVFIFVVAVLPGIYWWFFMHSTSQTPAGGVPVPATPTTEQGKADLLKNISQPAATSSAATDQQKHAALDSLSSDASGSSSPQSPSDAQKAKLLQQLSKPQ